MGQFENIKSESLWSREADIPPGLSLEGDIETETAVIGAGMAGLLTTGSQGDRLKIRQRRSQASMA